MKKTGSLPSKILGLLEERFITWAAFIQCSKYNVKDTNKVLEETEEGLMGLEDQARLIQESKSW